MARKTVTLTSQMEDWLRNVQASLMKRRKRDITFTEVVNIVLAQGIVHAAYCGEESEEQSKLFNSLLEGTDLSTAGVTDQLFEHATGQIIGKLTVPYSK